MKILAAVAVSLLTLCGEDGFGQMRVLLDLVGYEVGAPKMGIVAGMKQNQPTAFNLNDGFWEDCAVGAVEGSR